MKAYLPYPSTEIDTMLNEPWEVTDQPYKLFTSFVLNNLFELVVDEDELDGNGMDREIMWNRTFDKSLVDRLLIDLKEDFNDCADNYKPVRIWGRNYAIKKVNSYDHKRLDQLLCFQVVEGNNYKITKDGFLDLSGPVMDSLKKYEVSQSEAAENRLYFRQIVKLAEDDENDGWDKLTSLEVAIYLWGKFYHKYQTENFLHFQREYKDYLELKPSELLKYMDAKSTLRERPTSMYSFSCSKAEEYHKSIGVESVARKIPPEEAEDYWYEVALKNSFAPKG